MNLIDIITLLPQSDTCEDTIRRWTSFPRMYALSKTGSIRVYDITVEYCGDHSVMTTRKKVTLDGKWTEDRYEYWEGVNIGKSNETTFHEQALSEAQSSWKRLQDAGYTITMPDPSKKFNTDANGKIKPMLASPFDEKKIIFPCLCQPKYDGVRCTISKDSEGVHIISRKGKPYNIPHLGKWAMQNTHLLPLDGELYNHKDLSFQDIISAVKKVSEITSKIRYVVYDRPIEGKNNLERWRQLVQDFEKVESDAPAYRSDWVYCSDMDDLIRYHKTCVEKGYEGVIIRNYKGTYEFGFRSRDLIKMKDFDEDEFEIVDVVEATGRDAGTAVFVCMCEGGTFNVKPQGTRELRKEYLDNKNSLIGLYATVQYQGVSKDTIPRFPSAKSVRDYE